MGRITRRYVLGVVTATAALTLLAGLTPLASLLAAPLVDSEQPTRADAIVVLGGGVSRVNGALSRFTLERIETGARLWHDEVAPVVVFTGGNVHGNSFNEAHQAQPVLESLGVLPDAILLEDRAMDTHENAVNVLAIANSRGWSRLDVVTSPFHTNRSCRIFRKLSASITCIAANPSLLPSPSFFDRLNDVRAVVREYGATVYFTLKGYL